VVASYTGGGMGSKLPRQWVRQIKFSLRRQRISGSKRGKTKNRGRASGRLHNYSRACPLLPELEFTKKSKPINSRSGRHNNKNMGGLAVQGYFFQGRFRRKVRRKTGQPTGKTEGKGKVESPKTKAENSSCCKWGWGKRKKTTKKRRKRRTCQLEKPKKKVWEGAQNLSNKCGCQGDKKRSGQLARNPRSRRLP